MQAKNFSKGQVIFREGDQSSEAYRLLSGEVEINIATKFGAKTLARLSPGVFFGEMSLIDDKPRSATATALTDCKVEVFNEDNFSDRVLGDPGNLHLYLSTLFERIRDTDALLSLQLNRASGGQALAEKAPASSAPAAGGKAVEPASGPGKVHLRSRYDQTGWSGQTLDQEVTRFPFRIGRASESGGASPLSSNDLSVHDERPYHISRHHCAIEHVGDRLVVRDRGSRVGTVVNGVSIGPAFDSLVADLKLGGNTLILGADRGPHHFEIVVS